MIELNRTHGTGFFSVSLKFFLQEIGRRHSPVKNTPASVARKGSAETGVLS
ncbi:hypothetical protein AmDm5_2110 [Acetobacter malorum]|nr:hypothetical protein AmDm5_2110 [Acetobacter malorum]